MFVETPCSNCARLEDEQCSDCEMDDWMFLCAQFLAEGGDIADW